MRNHVSYVLDLVRLTGSTIAGPERGAGVELVTEHEKAEEDMVVESKCKG